MRKDFCDACAQEIPKDCTQIEEMQVALFVDMMKKEGRIAAVSIEVDVQDDRAICIACVKKVVRDVLL